MAKMKATMHLNGIRGVEVAPDVFVLENGYAAIRMAIEAHNGKIEPNSDDIVIPDDALQRAERMTTRRKVPLK